MPDINQSTGDVIVWADELCSSCRQNTVEECPLIHVLVARGITTATGMRVFDCGNYEMNPDSEHLIRPREDDMARQIEQATKGLKQQIELLLGNIV